MRTLPQPLHLLPLLLLAVTAGPRPALPADPEIQAQVVSVRSCDEFTARKSAKILAIRIAGIDCPSGKRSHARDAKAFVASLLHGQRVTVKPLGKDRQRRIWGDVFLSDGRAVAYEMVKAGWARVSPALINERLSELEEQARVAKKGIWHDGQDAAIGDSSRESRPK